MIFGASGATAPVIAGGHTRAPVESVPNPTPAFGFPVFGRSELRLLLSKRLKLVLNYSPIAYC